MKRNLLFQNILVMATVLVIGLMSAAPVSAAAALVATRAPGVQVKSFRDWKSEKIQQATSKFDQEKRRLDLLKAQKSKPARGVDEIVRAEQLLAQEEWNLEAAQDLTVTDYAVLYLSGCPVGTKFAEAASKMTTDEMGQLIEAYVRTSGGALGGTLGGTLSGEVKAHPSLPQTAIQQR
jgi:hypothetical protein